MDKDWHRNSQQALTFDVGRVERLTDRQRGEVVAALAEVIRAAASIGPEAETSNEDD